MYWTEEEAKTKWCPELKIEGSNASLKNSQEITYEAASCIASSCMMWRDEIGTPKGMPRKGYCGVAGKP